MKHATRLEHPHDDLGEDDYHEWVYLPSLRGQEMKVYRDSMGRRNGGSTMWLVLICNNTDCGGRMLVNAEAVARLADEATS